MGYIHLQINPKNINQSCVIQLKAGLFSSNTIQTRPQGYKTFSMLNSAEHEILDGHKYKRARNSAFIMVR